MSGVLALAAIMDELAARAGSTMDNVYAWPASTLTPPCFVVGYPPSITLDVTAGRGSDRMEVPCWAVFGKADERTSRDVMDPFLLNLKTALDGDSEVWQSARASEIVFETAVQDDGTEYLTARFTVDVLT
jgi:hypothetical protein